MLHPHSRLLLAAVAGVAALSLLSACGSSGNSSSSGTTAAPATTGAPATTADSPTTTTAARHHGDVDVLSAGSLDTVMTKVIAPAFHAATGYTLVDTSGGSGTLAADIKNKVDRADVFVSASPAVNTTLQGAKNGNWESWYAAFASSPVVLGYYPKSKFAKDLQTMPWYKVVTMPGFRLGRTNPAEDPGGVLAAEALKETAKAKHLPALEKLATESSDEYAEDPEQADIVSGQLDAAFMYEASANSQKSPFVELPGIHLSGDYTLTLLNQAPHQAAAEAFISYLLGPKGQAALRADHFAIVSPPKVTGHGVPSGLSSVLKS
ncbi:MAG TPA: extracellular solute-binding protein [Acidimicrobiales bacterium]|nr:extracellular solute-binding protein [Acidimicrobiales bacterium]